MIDYPYVKNPDVVVAMSQEAYSKFSRDLKKEGILIVEEDLVQIDTPPANVRLYKVPATRFAEEIGKKLVTNIVMVGFFTAVSGVISYDAMKKAVLDSIPKGTEDLNMKAFEKGYSYGRELAGRKAESQPA
jgi:2-oxoglutarate ferredoxin oxidoreductase subunit gamma